MDKIFTTPKVEQIYRDVHEILVLAKLSQSVTMEHLENYFDLCQRLDEGN